MRVRQLAGRDLGAIRGWIVGSKLFHWWKRGTSATGGGALTACGLSTGPPYVPEESSLNKGLDGTSRASVLRVGLLFSTRNDAGGKPAERARRRACRVSFSDATGSQVSCSPLDPWFVLADPSALDRGRWRLP